MTDKNRQQDPTPDHDKSEARGDKRDDQADGHNDRRAEEHKFARPGTNREAVPGGIEGSIMEDE